MARERRAAGRRVEGAVRGARDEEREVAELEAEGVADLEVLRGEVRVEDGGVVRAEAHGHVEAAGEDVAEPRVVAERREAQRRDVRRRADLDEGRARAAEVLGRDVERVAEAAGLAVNEFDGLYFECRVFKSFSGG